MPKLELNIEHMLDDAVRRGQAILTREELDCLAAKLTSARAAQRVVVEQTYMPGVRLFDGHDFAQTSIWPACECRACVITRANDTAYDLSEMLVTHV